MNVGNAQKQICHSDGRLHPVLEFGTQMLMQGGQQRCPPVFDHGNGRLGEGQAFCMQNKQQVRYMKKLLPVYHMKVCVQSEQKQMRKLIAF